MITTTARVAPRIAEHTGTASLYAGACSSRDGVHSSRPQVLLRHKRTWSGVEQRGATRSSDISPGRPSG